MSFSLGDIVSDIGMETLGQGKVISIKAPDGKVEYGVNFGVTTCPPFYELYS